MTIRKASFEDLPRILELRDLAREIMRNDGNRDQWPMGYPAEATFRKDIEKGNTYMIEEGDKCIATFAFIPGPDPTYSIIYGGAWTDETLPYYVIHRICSTPESHGVMDAILQFGFSQTNNIRIDTHCDNHIMRRALQRHGFAYCGIILCASGDERLAFQKTIKNDIRHEET